MVVLGHFYYFFGLLLFLANLGLILKLNKILKTQNWVRSFLKVTNKKPEKKDLPHDDYQDFMNYNSIMMVNFLWVFFGLISQSWKVFLSTLIILFVTNLIITSLERFKFITNFLNFVKLYTISAVICITVINHFHIHTDLYQEIVKFLSRH